MSFLCLPGGIGVHLVLSGEPEALVDALGLPEDPGVFDVFFDTLEVPGAFVLALLGTLAVLGVPCCLPGL